MSSEAGPARKKSREEIAQAYSSEPWWYDVRGFLILTFAYRSTLWNQLRFFGPNIGERHLEVAIGTGTLFELVLGWRRRKRLPVTQVTGVDYAESMLAGAMHRFRKHPEIELLHADVAAMDFPDAITRGLRRNTDIARGCLEKTRGDLTHHSAGHNLERELSSIRNRLSREADQLLQAALR